MFCCYKLNNFVKIPKDICLWILQIYFNFKQMQIDCNRSKRSCFQTKCFQQYKSIFGHYILKIIKTKLGTLFTLNGVSTKRMRSTESLLVTKFNLKIKNCLLKLEIQSAGHDSYAHAWQEMVIIIWHLSKIVFSDWSAVGQQHVDLKRLP